MDMMASDISVKQAHRWARRLLDWYDAQGRDLPWRVKGGARPDPYRVWLSEIMLQQTTVAAVRDYFEKFTAAWPTVEALAAAADEEVLAAWAGLGYYARARNLLKCARAVVAQHGGRFPDNAEALLALPGIGPYTAAAIAAIAFDAPAVVVDGNVERVMARLFAVETPLPQAKPALRAHAARLTPKDRPGDYAQAVMDLGATICAPRNPSCLICPWQAGCRARTLPDPARYPLKAPKAAKPVRQGLAFWLEAGGRVLTVRRPEKGLLGGMRALPSSPWRSGLELDDAWPHAPCQADWRLLSGHVDHVFTHFALELRVAKVAFDRRPAIKDGAWIDIGEVENIGLPTIMKKAALFARAAK